MRDEIEPEIKERGSRTEFREKFKINGQAVVDLIGRMILAYKQEGNSNLVRLHRPLEGRTFHFCSSSRYLATAHQPTLLR